MKVAGLGIGALFALLGCAAPPPERSPYEVGSVAGVLFSNSLVALHDVRPHRTPRGFELDYAVLFQNESHEMAVLGIADAAAQLDGKPAALAVHCAEHGVPHSQGLELSPAQRVRVDCRVTLLPAGLAAARGSDAEIELRLPVLRGGQVLSIALRYRLLHEDFT